MVLFKEIPELKNLIAIILKVDDTIVENILTHYPSIHEMIEAQPQEFQQIFGIGHKKANQLHAAFQLVRIALKPRKEIIYIRSARDVYGLLECDFKFIQTEHFVCLFLNTKNGIIGKEVISIGSLNAAVVHPREVFRAAIRYNSASIICVHNHPSGDPTPSNEDIELTKRLVAAGENIGIEVLDHVVIGDSSYLSMKEKGLM